MAKFLDDPTDPENWNWLCETAARGNSAAQFTVALRYRDGLPPVSRNDERAYRWLTAATRNGLSAAAIAREDLLKSLSEAQLKRLHEDKRPANQSDCAITP